MKVCEKCKKTMIGYTQSVCSSCLEESAYCNMVETIGDILAKEMSLKKWNQIEDEINMFDIRDMAREIGPLD